MNVAFHELVAVAIATEVATSLGPPSGSVGSAARPRPAPARRARAAVWTLACGLAVLSHGILDGLPHYYPLGSAGDATVSLLLVAVALVVAPRWARVPLFALCVATVLPDIIDHVPRDVNRHFGRALLPDHAPFFPWHWRSGSGSFPGRSGPLWRESLVNHAIVVAFCAAVLVRGARRARGRRRAP